MGFHISMAAEAEDAGKKYKNLPTLIEAEKQCSYKEAAREPSFITWEEVLQMHVVVFASSGASK
jgi:hypothetical protein